MGLITNELVTNSLKHAFPDKNEGVITIKAKEEGNLCFFQVSDNGIGIDHSAKNSWGMTLIQDYSVSLGGDYSFLNNNGAHFNLIIPKSSYDS